MGWIKNRIDAEYKKHKKLDWSKLAEAKIKSNIKEMIDKIMDKHIRDGNTIWVHPERKYYGISLISNEIYQKLKLKP